MYKLIIKIENTEREEDGYDGVREKTLEFDTKADMEAFTIDPEKAVGILYNLYLMAEENGILDPVEDDGDDYNGDTTNDINA